MGQLRFLRTVDPKAHGLWTHLISGFRGRCPRCLEGRIFEKGLTVKGECPTCGLNLHAHDSGDGPAVAATFFLGALALGVALWLEIVYRPPMWVHVAVAIPIVAVGSVIMLRPLKGMLVAMQYRFRSVDQEDENLGQM